MLANLLTLFPAARTLLDIGCGAGHFTIWLREQGVRVLGIERAPTMLRMLRRRCAELPVVVADAQHLPLKPRAVDLCLFVTTLEFLDDPLVALREAVAAARQGTIAVVLNCWSLGGLARRFGRRSRHPLLSRARDYSLPQLRALLTAAAGSRLRSLSWTATLFPFGIPTMHARIPLGDVLAIAVTLSD